ncbi:MAG: hypothetical protein WCY72_11875 [Lysobacteraceae bacterium]
MGLTDMLEGKQKAAEGTASLVAFMVDATSHQQMSRALAQLGVTDAHTEIGTLNDLIRYLEKAEKSPDRLIVDISGLDKPLDALDRLADACDPSVTVFAVGEKNDVTLYRLLLQAGITDYRYKPITADALRGWIDAGDGFSVRQARSGKIIAVAGSRGGIGVTSVAGQLARELNAGSASRKVVYVDMNVQGGAGTTLMGLAPNEAMTEALDSLEALDGPFLERVLTTQDKRLFTLGFNLGFDTPYEHVPGSISALLERLSQHFHYLVVDLASPGGALADEVYARANTICLLCDASVHSGRVLSQLLPHLRGMVDSPVIHLIANTVRPGAAHLEPRDLAQTLTHPVAMSIPYDGRLPATAEDLGQPLQKDSQMAKYVTRLARTITGEAVDADEGSGWLRRLFRKGR